MKKTLKFYFYLLAGSIILLPLLYLLTGSEWLYSPMEMIDGYSDLSYSYFYNYSNIDTYFYKAARVPWVSLIYLVQKLVGPFLLMPVMVCSSWISLGLLYFVLFKRVFGNYRVIYLLPWVVLFPHLVGSSAGGGLYNNCASMAFIILALIFWNSETNSDKSKSAVLKTAFAGFLLATSIFTNIIYINFVLIFPILDLQKNNRRPLKLYLFGFLGIISSGVFWGVINICFGRPFFFFKYMIDKTSAFVLTPETVASWWHPLREVFTMSQFQPNLLVFLLCLFLVAVVKLGYKIFRKGYSTQDLLTGHYIFIFSFWFFWHWLGVTALSPTDFLYPLELPALLMVVSWIKEGDLKKEDLFVTAGSAVILWFFVLISVYVRRSFVVPDFGFYVFYFLVFIAFLYIFFVSGDSKAKSGYFLILAFTFSLTDPDPHARLDTNCTFREDSNKSINQIVTSLQNLGAPDTFFFFADKRRVLSTGKRCLNRHEYNPSYIFRNASVIIGIPLSESAETADDLTVADFEKMETVTDSKLVLFPDDSMSDTPKILKKALEARLVTTKIFSSTVKVLDQELPYEVYEVEPALPDIKF